jgi:polyisoprenoid-binding protein YceI
VRHLGISWVPGDFKTFEGKYSFDPKNIKSSTAEATITTKSISTDNQKRDDHLRSPDFFNAESNPTITFKSKEITDISGNNFKVKGMLSINGIEKEIVLDAEFLGAVKDPWGNERSAFSASAKINRKDFGLTWNKLLETGGLVVGEEVVIQLEIEGIKS